MSRDYAADMRAIIDAATGDGPYLPRRVADHIVQTLRATDPDLLDNWLHLQASNLVFQAIDARDRSRRAHVKRTSGRGHFSAALGDYHDGDTEPLRRFLDMPLTVDSGHHKRLADLTADDLRFVARTYAQRAQDNALMAAFLRVLATKVGRGTVAERYTDEQLARVWQSAQDGVRR